MDQDKAEKTEIQWRAGKPEEDHRTIEPTTGQQRGYVVLTAEERAKGFIRPVRTSYLHTACDAITTMSQAIAETYARNPKFYSGTFCCQCRKHFPLAEFQWLDGAKLGE